MDITQVPSFTRYKIYMGPKFLGSYVIQTSSLWVNWFWRNQFAYKIWS